MVESRYEIITQHQRQIRDIGLPLSELLTTSTMEHMGVTTKPTVKILSTVHASSTHGKKEKKSVLKVTAKDKGFQEADLRQSVLEATTGNMSG